MEAIAKTRHLKGSPRKARLVIDLIRGRNVSQALAILKFTNKRAADPITKTLRSAIANATYLAEQQNIAIDPDDLWVKTCFVDMGAHKNRSRMRPAPQGRAYREQRHYCHITVLLSSDLPKVEESDKPRVKGKKLLAKEALASGRGEKIPATAKKAEAKEETVDSTVVVNDPVAAMENTQAVEANNAQDTAQASDAKNVQSQTPAERHETAPADEAMLNNNDQLEGNSGNR